MLAAGMSDDSDYTSDIHPSQHQENMSAHQFPRDPQGRASARAAHARYSGGGYQHDYYATGDDYYAGDVMPRRSSYDDDPDYLDGQHRCV